METDLPKSVHDGFAKAGLEQSQRHLFLCIGPDCCPADSGLESWEFLKKCARELNLPVMRTKAACFRICSEGPWMVVYPDGIWYSEASPERLERILVEHVQNGAPVTEWIAAIHPLEPPLPAE